MTFWNSPMICCITGKRLVVREFTAIITKRKIRITLFYLSRGTAKAKVSITKLNRERNNLPNRVYVCRDHFEHDSFDFPWILQSTLSFSGKSIQRLLLPEKIRTKFLRKLVQERHFSKQREETHPKRGIFFSYSSKTVK